MIGRSINIRVLSKSQSSTYYFYLKHLKTFSFIKLNAYRIKTVVVYPILSSILQPSKYAFWLSAVIGWSTR